MVTLNRIYTKTGDDGSTSLSDGTRRPKYDIRIEAYGTVDETNATLGLVAAHLQDETLKSIILSIQNDLFDLGADLATPDTGEPLPYEPLRITAQQVTALETHIDALNKTLNPLKSFILPGGSPAAAALHLARTVCRRAERLTILAKEQDPYPISQTTIHYLNRLSDLLFVMARIVNASEGGDILWVPGKNRA